ncbi:tRNA preQ1(34) S-adenosylmethionine ribosyltransferase-isomerase QueA [Nitrospina gracilis]|uniref:tRNA preQ1(34) S-adenosylmethionine ribosyltransferase-isomerase QueA n=1 Tax=Nitrospina gracilis TaxID=35801 RepID=UPI001F0266C4|nr:tRNA preQ1(34) S-adenosylmethionine ribosyltransferase-isomerase QueA [Nitrospina gracilis]MCF8720525.1 S-adenosylmethionine:tRNA ribosyltransferase-isomerase [Nitrospina gracilis Nb-211]
MNISDFDFHLPEELIAQTPAQKRDDSRLLVVDRKTSKMTHRGFSDFTDFLTDRPLLIFNNTRVLPAKLTGQRADTGKPVEWLLVRRVEPACWLVLTRGLSKLKPGQAFQFGNGLSAAFEQVAGDMAQVRFSSEEALRAALNREGKMPLPHYIKRGGDLAEKMDLLDRERYQTVFAREEGAIAAPTAGLHFTPEMMKHLESKADVGFLTLHVGPGTFQPVRVDKVTDHQMKEEFYRIPADTWNRIHKAKVEGRPVLAVGTTSTRVLESVRFDQPVEQDVEGWTNRFLYPGQPFHTVDRLLTNFHLPRSTLFLLVCAFAGKPLMERAYKGAIAEKYRFFSYGDAMLIL